MQKIDADRCEPRDLEEIDETVAVQLRFGAELLLKTPPPAFVAVVIKAQNLCAVWLLLCKPRLLVHILKCERHVFFKIDERLIGIKQQISIFCVH